MAMIKFSMLNEKDRTNSTIFDEDLKKQKIFRRYERRDERDDSNFSNDSNDFLSDDKDLTLIDLHKVHWENNWPFVVRLDRKAIRLRNDFLEKQIKDEVWRTTRETQTFVNDQL